MRSSPDDDGDTGTAKYPVETRSLRASVQFPARQSRLEIGIDSAPTCLRSDRRILVAAVFEMSRQALRHMQHDVIEA